MRFLPQLAMASALALACNSGATAQSSTTVQVKNALGATVSMAGQTDASGAFHYRDVMEGLQANGTPTAVLVDSSGFAHVVVEQSALPTGGATSANQATANTSLAQIVTNTASNATATNQTAVQAVAGSDASKATAVQGLTGGKPVAITGNASRDGSATITTGGTAQALFGGATPTNGFKVAYPSATSGSNVCWVSDTTTTPSATTAGSYPVYQQGQWSTEPGETPAGPVYINCPTTGMAISAKRW